MTKNEKAAPEKPISKNAPDKKITPPGTPSNKNETKTEKPRSVNWPLRILVGLMLLIIGAGISIYYIPVLKERLPIVAEWIGENESIDIASVNQTLTDHQQQIEDLVKKSLDQDAALSQLSSGLDNTILSELEQRILSLESSTEMDETANSAQPTAPQDTSQATRIDMLLSRMSQLEASFIPLSKNMLDAVAAEKDRAELKNKNTEISANISNLETRLSQVEALAAKDNSGILLNLKIAELKRKIKSGISYNEELSALSQIIEKSTLNANTRVTNALNYLSERAETGLTTPDQLRNNFNSLIPDILKQGNLAVDASWWEETLNTFKNMITVRKTDGTSYNNAGLDGLIATIEQWLLNEDFKSILDGLSALPQTVQLLLEDWKLELERWSKSDDALNDLESIAADDYLNVNYERTTTLGDTETEL